MKDKTTAAILAFLLGTFGVHRFYLGEAGVGVGFLVAFVLFLPLATLLGLIDGVRYLGMSQDEFDYRYNSPHMGVPGLAGAVHTKVTVRKVVIGPDGQRREVVEEHTTGPAWQPVAPRPTAGAGGSAEYSRRRPRDRAECERFVLQAAADHNGFLTVADLVRVTQLGLTEARDALNSLQAQGVCDMDVDHEGLVHYLFPDFHTPDLRGLRMTGTDETVDGDLHAS